MAKREDIESQIAALQKELEDSDDEDFDIEIWSGDKGARVPYKKGKNWFEKTFGIDLGTPTDPPKSRGKGTGKPGDKDGDGVPGDDEGKTGGPRVLRHLGQNRDAS